MDIRGRLEFPCSSCAGAGIALAMSLTQGTSSGSVRRLASSSSCAFGVVSFQIITCSSWLVFVSISCSKSLFKGKKISCQIETQQTHIGAHRSTSENFRFNKSYFRAISLRSSFNICAWSLAIRTSALNWECAAMCACARACHA